MRRLLGILLCLGTAHGASVTSHPPRRTGCSSESERAASRSTGTPLLSRSTRSGETEPCYQVAAEIDGKKIEGYLPASAIDDLDTFDKARRTAAVLDISKS